MCASAASSPSTTATDEDRVEVFGVPVVGARGLRSADRAPAPAHRRAARSRHRAARRPPRRLPGSCASSSSVSIAPQMPVRRILALSAMRARHLRVGGRHGRRCGRCRRGGRAPARGRRPAPARPGPCRRAARSCRSGPAARSIAPTAARSCVGTSWTASAGHARRRQPVGQRGVDRAVRMDRLAAAAQQHRVARAQAQRRGVGGDVGAALVDDADQPDRHAHAGQLQPVGRDRCGRSPRRPDRAARRPPRPRRRRLRAALDRACSRSSIAGGQAVGLAGGEIAGVGGEDLGPAARNAAAAGRRAAALPASSSRASTRCAARPARASSRDQSRRRSDRDAAASTWRRLSTATQLLVSRTGKARFNSPNRVWFPEFAT